jgi:cation transport protein ChaC
MGASDGDIWVFGYGSLMWRPGFAFVERTPALLRGFHRALCVYSHHYRGTPDRPGLVLGLERGGSCRGVAFRVAAAEAAAVLDYLDEREIPHAVYHRRLVPIEVHADPAWPHGGPAHPPVPPVAARRHGGPAIRRVPAYTYVTRHDHAQYAGRLPIERCVALVIQGVGRSGTAHEYLENTVGHLEAMGFRVPWLNRLRRRVRERMGDPSIG